MKNFRVLLAVIATVAMLFSVVSADDSAVNFGAATIEYKDLSNNLVISIYAGIDATIAGGSGIGVSYDTSKWVYDSYVNSSAVAGSSAVDNGDYISVGVTVNDGNDTPFTVGKHLMDIVFKPADGMTLADLNETEFTFYDDGALFDADYNSPAYSGSIKVVAAEEEKENVATYVTNELALEVDGEVHNFSDVPVYTATTAATSFKLKAVYGENENYLKFNGSDVIEVSNIKVEGEGDVSFQVAIIGVPAGVTIDKLIVE